MKKFIYKKYSKEDQIALAQWAIFCTERVTHLFKEKYPDDDRPTKAIEALEKWIETGIFSMSVIRKASLDSHAAARECEDDTTRFVARSAGQAVGTAHVTQHAFGAAYYALKAVMAADPEHAEENARSELKLQLENLPDHLKDEVSKKLLLMKEKKRIKIKIIKEGEF